MGLSWDGTMKPPGGRGRWWHTCTDMEVTRLHTRVRWQLVPAQEQGLLHFQEFCEAAVMSAHWQLKIGKGENIFAMKTDKFCKSGLLRPPPAEKASITHALAIPLRTPRGMQATFQERKGWGWGGRGGAHFSKEGIKINNTFNVQCVLSITKFFRRMKKCLPSGNPMTFTILTDCQGWGET